MDSLAQPRASGEVMSGYHRFRLGIFDPFDPLDKPAIIDHVFTTDDADEVRQTIRDYYTLIDGENIPYSIGFFPAEAVA